MAKNTLKLIFKCLILIIFIASILDCAYADTYYFYDRYSVKGAFEPHWNIEYEKSRGGLDQVVGKDGFRVDPKTGKWEIYGNDVTYGDVCIDGKTAYYYSNYWLYKCDKKPLSTSTYYRRSGYITDAREKGYYVSTISASNGTYPANGISGSYWYVRGGISNRDPYTTLTTINNLILSENEGYNQLTISGTIKDQDIGDNLTVKYTIKDTTNNTLLEHGNRIIQNGIVADGTEQSFNDFTISIDNTIDEGNYGLFVWTEDNEGGKSNEELIIFTVDKTGPSIYTNNKQVINLNTYIKFDIFAIDAANPLNDVSINYSSSELNISGSGIYKVSTDKIFVHPNTDASLIDGKDIIINIQAKDRVDNTKTYYIKIKIDSTGNTNPNDL